MSALEQAVIEEVGEDVLVRHFAATVAAADGRTLDIKIVPFGERAVVADGLGGLPKGHPYEEEWMPGVFDRQLDAANRVLLNFEHEGGFANIVGHGVALRSARDGYHGSFRVTQGNDGDKALELVNAGVLTGASVEVPARTLKSVRTRDGIVQRVKGHLDKVALCRVGAFASAGVTAVRMEQEIVDEALLPPKISDELVARCRRIGIAIPESFRDVVERAFTDVPWDGSPSRWSTAAEYCSAAAIDLNPAGKPKTKALCHLPYKEPGTSTVNLGGVRAALARIGQGLPAEASQEQRDAAKATLERLLVQAKGN